MSPCLRSRSALCEDVSQAAISASRGALCCFLSFVKPSIVLVAGQPVSPWLGRVCIGEAVPATSALATKNCSSRDDSSSCSSKNSRGMFSIEMTKISFWTAVSASQARSQAMHPCMVTSITIARRSQMPALSDAVRSETKLLKAVSAGCAAPPRVVVQTTGCGVPIAWCQASARPPCRRRA